MTIHYLACLHCKAMVVTFFLSPHPRVAFFIHVIGRFVIKHLDLNL